MGDILTHHSRFFTSPSVSFSQPALSHRDAVAKIGPVHHAMTMQRPAVPRLHVYFWLTALLFAMALAAGIAPRVEAQPDTAAADLIVYVRDGCPHCADAKEFLADLARQRPGLRIVYRQVDRDAAAREALVQLTRDAGMWPPGVPTFVANGRLLVGFDGAESTGPAVLALIEHPAQGRQPDASALSGMLSASEMGLPLFTLAMGLLDGFNPCAMWVLLFLLSLLVRLQDRRRMAMVAGTFVLASGAVYFAFMAAWLNVFLLVGISGGLRVGLGLVALAVGLVNVKDFFAFGRGVSLSIPESAKPGIYARVRSVLNAEALPASMVAVAVLAVVVNFVELLCTAGFPAIYTAVLAQHDLDPWAHYAYLGLYIVGYLVDDALMVTVAVITLGHRKLTERGGRWLKLVSGAVMLALGIVMIARPEWLM